ncbi:beta-lactamase family protein [Luteolibacter pohnpeiensis]|uniref:Beta-lactamase family protein n=1 Tax=Luteolibacter pohnpeiensis TaxID=454153 RepID=A0A934VTF1_9BACT|nr:serine hydrolase domain-containing protein [Luteolibacter pohnpeiensis]MBK1881422.1 beta-lactamase family protein [Luteolibacter pohnpeiensis]
MISGFGRIFAGWVLLSVALASASPADIGDDLTQLLSAEVPGIAAAAYLQGEVVAAGVAGYRKVGSPEKVTLEDRFHLGSCTKSMTATLAAILVKEGEISWSTTCGEAFGEMKMNSAFRKVTLKELLTNTGGLPTDVPSQLWHRPFAKNNCRKIS